MTIYLEAAKYIDAVPINDLGCCYTLTLFYDTHGIETVNRAMRAMADLFESYPFAMDAGDLWGLDDPGERRCDVLALLLMHAMETK